MFEQDDLQLLLRDLFVILSRFLAEFWPVKMSQAFHDPLICFNFLYFHRKVNTFKTPEMCLYLDSDVLSQMLITIIFVGSFHYFKPISCWILFCEKVAGVSRPFNQLPLNLGKVNTFQTPVLRLYFDSDV